MNKLEIYRGGEIIASIDIDEGTVFSEKLPGTDLINCPVLTKDVVDLQEEDYIFHKGNPYKIRILPEFGKDGSTLAKSYKIDFLAIFYDLIDIYVQHEGAHVFPYYGNARMQLQMCLDSVNTENPGWVIGDIAETEDLLLKYDWTFVRTALDQIAEAFGLEWKADGKTINMVKSIGQDTGLVFEMGRGKGLHQVSRSSDTSKEKLTRIYGVGGTTNIDSTYRNGTESNLVFEERYVETPGVTAGTERVRMGKYENLEIYPRFEGVVSSVVFEKDSTGKITSCTITDPAIDFDVMAHMQEGVKGQVSFRTGPVTGIDFEISAASLSNKTITLVPFTDQTGYYYPSDTSQPEIGNKFTLIKMRMPLAYKVRAENELKEKTTEFRDDNKLQRVIYNVKPDESHLRNNLIGLRCGDKATLIDTDFGVNQLLRFTEISYPLVNEYDVTAIIGNDIKYDRVAKLFADVIQSKQQIASINLTNAQEARRNSKNLIELRDLMIDPDGNYYADKIRPGSIETLYFSTGAKATHFDLVGISFDANHLGNPNSFTATAGQLVHYDLKIEGTGFAWEMQPYSISTLVAANQYWLYARISKTTLVGSWVLSTEILLAESEPGYYTLQAGVLFPVIDGRRDHQLTKGMVFIIGDQITAGRMKSIDNRMFIDLTTGQLSLGDSTSGLDWNVSAPNRLTIRGGVIQSGSGIITQLPSYRGLYNAGVLYFKGDTVLYNGSQWMYINDTPQTGQTPAANIYWGLYVSKGTDGINGLNGTDGTPGAPGTSTYFHVAYANSADGSQGFNQSGGVYIGTYVDNNPVDSGNYQSYHWVLLKGADGTNGTNGIPGVNGADGRTSYLHIKYSNDGGASFTANAGESSGAYIGQYVDFTLEDSNNPGMYTWALIKGADGSPGTNGSNGSNGNYTEFIFQKNGSTTQPPSLNGGDPNPGGWSVTQPYVGPLEYLWMSSSIKSGTTGGLITQWSYPARTTSKDGDPGATGQSGQPGANGAPGTPGNPGPQGQIGPTSPYQGDYNDSKVYYGNTLRVDVVKFNGTHYVARVDAGTFSGYLPTDTSKWNPFGAEYDSVATKILLANAATIDNLTVRNVVTAEPDAFYRMVISGSENSLSSYRAGKLCVFIHSNNTNEGIVYYTNEPITAPGGGYGPDFLYYRVVGGQPRWYFRATGPGVSIGVSPNDADGFSSIGRKKIYTSGDLEVRGAIFKNGVAVPSSYQCTSKDHTVILNQANGTCYLPIDNKEEGREIRLRNLTGSNITISSNINDILPMNGGTPVNSFNLPANTPVTLMYTSTFWIFVG